MTRRKREVPMPTPDGPQFDPRLLDFVEEGPQSFPDSDTGIDWLDHRTNRSQFEGAISRHKEQKYLKELGETQRLRPGSIAMSRHMGSKEREVPLREVRYEKDGDPFSREVVSEAPPTHLFRGMSEDEFQKSKAQGFIKSDGRGAIMPEWEGTNAGHSAGTAHSYLPSSGPGRIVKIRVNEDDRWFGSNVDSYARTRQQIPWDRIEAHTSPIDKSERVFPGPRPTPNDGRYDAEGNFIES